MLTDSAKDWGLYDEMRSAINEPLEKLEAELKRYRKFFDPTMGSKKLSQKKATWEDQKNKAEEMYTTIKRCYNTIIVLAGDDKKEFLDREVINLSFFCFISFLIEKNDQRASFISHDQSAWSNS